MNNVFISLFFSIVTSSLSQITFDQQHSDHNFYRKAVSADSAIKKGEFGEIHSLLIVKNGKPVFETYYNGWSKDSLHQLQSATKSIVSTLLGCAIQAKMIQDENEFISKYYPSYNFDDSLKKKIRIRDLLTQRHGFNWSEGAWEDPKNSWRKVLDSPGDWYKKIIETPMADPPGTKFIYSNAAPVLISGIIQNAAKMDIDRFAELFLFNKLGISKYWIWSGNGGARNNGLALISLRSRDMAKIGQLYLQNGKWNSQQILPETFVSKASSAIVQKVGINGLYKHYDYGYFWWSNPVTNSNKKTTIFLARGAGGQNIIINRNENLVVVITAWNMQQPNKPQLIYDHYIAN